MADVPYSIEIFAVCAECGEPLEVTTDDTALALRGEAPQAIRLQVAPCNCVDTTGLCANRELCPLYEEV